MIDKLYVQNIITFEWDILENRRSLEKFNVQNSTLIRERVAKKLIISRKRRELISFEKFPVFRLLCVLSADHLSTNSHVSYIFPAVTPHNTIKWRMKDEEKSPKVEMREKKRRKTNRESRVKQKLPNKSLQKIKWKSVFFYSLISDGREIKKKQQQKKYFVTSPKIFNPLNRTKKSTKYCRRKSRLGWVFCDLHISPRLKEYTLSLPIRLRF